MIPKHQQQALSSAYREACNNYLSAFADKHGFDMVDCAWVSDEPGGVAIIGDYYSNMADIVTDIDKNAPVKEWFAWYNYTLECNDLGMPNVCNYQSWLRGCPRYSEEKLEEIRSLKRKLEMSRKILEIAIRDSETTIPANPF